MPVSSEYVRQKQMYDENFWSVYGRLTAEIDHALVNNIKARGPEFYLEFDFSEKALQKIGRDIPYFFDEENVKRASDLKMILQAEYEQKGWNVEFDSISRTETIIFSYKPEKIKK